MNLREKVVVVTGGGSGIGAALCRRFAAEGARGVAVADLDGDSAARVAGEVDGMAFPCDVSQEAQVRELIERTRERFGPIDLFCANAGTGAGTGGGLLEGGPFVSDEAWSQSWNVNLMAHVYAARAVLPEMLERKSGYLLTTASAAGLLTEIGSLAYSVTKHAALAFAEWLAIRYAELGIGVSCLCPQGVRTPMLEGAVEASGGARHLVDGALDPEDVAEVVVAGLAREDFLILPHPEVAGYFQRKAADYDRWLAGMRRLRAKTFPPDI